MMEGNIGLLGYGLAALGAAIGVGLVFAAYLNGVARQPEARSVLSGIAIFGFAVIEALALLGFALLFIIK